MESSGRHDSIYTDIPAVQLTAQLRPSPPPPLIHAPVRYYWPQQLLRRRRTRWIDKRVHLWKKSTYVVTWIRFIKRVYVDVHALHCLLPGSAGLTPPLAAASSSTTVRARRTPPACLPITGTAQRDRSTTTTSACAWSSQRDSDSERGGYRGVRLYGKFAPLMRGAAAVT